MSLRFKTAMKKHGAGTRAGFRAVLALTLLAALLLAACGQGAGTGAAATTSTAAAVTTAAATAATTAGSAAAATVAAPAAAATTAPAATTAAAQTTAPAAAAAPAGDPLPMRWILPGQARNDDKMVEEALHLALLEDGLNIQPEYTYYGWDVWEQKTNVILAAGDPFEMIHTMDNGSPSTSVLLSKQAIIPLNDLIAEHGQVMKNLFSQAVWDQATINGNIMAIPAPWIDMKVENYGAMRQDKLDKYGLALPQSLDELVEAAKIIADGEKAETGTSWYMSLRNEGNVGLFKPLQRGIEGWPFVIGDMMAIVYGDGNVASYLESPQFKEWCDFTLKANQYGIIYPDLLSMDSGSFNDPMAQGTFLASDRNFAGEARLRQQYDPEARIVNFALDDSKPLVRLSNYPNCNTVLTSSPNPETAVQFMNWLYSDQAHMDLLIFGIEGTHWVNEGERQYSVPEYNINGDTIRSEYQFGFSWTGWAPFNRFDVVSDWQKSAETEYTFDSSVESFVTSGFIFSPENVAAEYANCKSVITTYINPIMLGFQNYDEAFPSALQRMKDAGLDKVLEEYRVQFAAFMASK